MHTVAQFPKSVRRKGTAQARTLGQRVPVRPQSCTNSSSNPHCNSHTPTIDNSNTRALQVRARPTKCSQQGSGVSGTLIFAVPCIRSCQCSSNLTIKFGRTSGTEARFTRQAPTRYCLGTSPTFARACPGLCVRVPGYPVTEMSEHQVEVEIPMSRIRVSGTRVRTVGIPA
eukprot:1418425-Rhodomonas_salina.3